MSHDKHSRDHRSGGGTGTAASAPKVGGSTLPQAIDGGFRSAPPSKAGARTLTEQLSVEEGTADTAIDQVVPIGRTGAGRPLPGGDMIQRVFGRHVSSSDATADRTGAEPTSVGSRGSLVASPVLGKALHATTGGAGMADYAARSIHRAEHPIASGLVQRKARAANGIADDAEHVVAAASSSSGSPLPNTLMRKFETSLSVDLSSVRVHVDAASERGADAVGAKAYAIGNDIHFGAGHYDPSSVSGQQLLAHEVTHTVQQSGGAQRMQCKLEVSSPEDSLECEADRAADAMVRGEPATISAGSGAARYVQRNPTELGGVASASKETSHADFDAALAARDSQKAAEILNGFNATAMQAVLVTLKRGEIASIHVGAVENPRVGPGSAVADATRWAYLDLNYENEMGRENWQGAAKYLNGFNRDDILSRLRKLDSVNVQKLHDGAVANPAVGNNSQLAEISGILLQHQPDEPGASVGRTGATGSALSVTPPKSGIDKVGFVDNSDGANIRTGPLESGGQTVRDQPLPPATRVFVSGRHPVMPRWWYVTASLEDMIVRGYVQDFRITTDLPEPTAKLHQVVSGDTAERLAVKEYGSAVRDGHDLRYYENVLLYVNQQQRRAGIIGTYQDPGVLGGGSNNVQLVAGHRIWLVSPAYAKALESVVPSGSLTGGAVAQVKRFAGHLEDILKSVTESPHHFGEVAGEYAQAIRAHLPEIVGIVAAFIAAESLSAFLAATPTGVGQIAAVVIQLALAAFGAAGMVQAGVDAVTHAVQWLTLAWTAKGTAERIAAASVEFLKMLVSIAIAALAYVGVKGNYGNALKIANSMPTGSLRALAVAGGGKSSGEGAGTRALVAPGTGPIGAGGNAMTQADAAAHGGSRTSDATESSATEEAAKKTRPAPAQDNYRGRYNAARAAEGKPRLPDDWDAHHRIPREYREHPEFKSFDFDAPDNIQGVKGSRSDVNIHQEITNRWADFRRQVPDAKRSQIEDFARKIDAEFQQHWWK